jgi:hypothetical protein
LTVGQVLAAMEGGMPLERFAAMGNVHKYGDFTAAREKLAADAEAPAEAERQAAVERAKRDLDVA